MICCALRDEFRFEGLPPGVRKAAGWLRALGPACPPDGKYEIDGDRVFALVQRYGTAPAEPPKFEAHRKFIDVQYVAEGAEVIGCAPLALLRVSEPYDGEKDVCFGSVPDGAWTPLALKAGELAVLWPADAHAPRLPSGAPGPVVKIVVKVAA